MLDAIISPIASACPSDSGSANVSARASIHSTAASPSSQACFRLSASPDRNSSLGSVASVSRSQSTRLAGQKVPTRFLPSEPSSSITFTAVFPPIEASTIASSVVGTSTSGTPRRRTEAA